MSDTQDRRTNAYIRMLEAGIMDAAEQRKLSQLKITSQTPKMSKPKIVRIIIVPDEMDVEWPKPLEADR